MVFVFLQTIFHPYLTDFVVKVFSLLFMPQLISTGEKKN